MVQIGENWKCPYCGHAQVLHRDRVDDQWHHQNVKGWKHFGIHPIVSISAIVCANSECRELTLNAILGRSNLSRDDAVEGPYKTWTLLPPSSARPQPNYIPKAIRDNYYEACAICELSPEASATVIRRCLQGMIRDFCSVSRFTVLRKSSGSLAIFPRSCTWSSISPNQAIPCFGTDGDCVVGLRGLEPPTKRL
jgi:hypothetical protein